MTISHEIREQFLETIWEYYAQHGRHDLPWRKPEADGSFNLYKILVSELMLQQTQVGRVVPKYLEFLERFPTVQSLASSSLGEVLKAWQGLGYNRRAKFLWQSAQALTESKQLPDTLDELIKLPGVGVNTAGAILAYAFNQPVLFIETNIRTVYIHHFARDSELVADSFIRDILEQTVDRERPREFYWALMDYGAWLKTQVRNISQSKHYVRQSAFAGSRRQLRGQIVRELASQRMSFAEIDALCHDKRLTQVLDTLVDEGMIVLTRGNYRLQ